MEGLKINLATKQEAFSYQNHHRSTVKYKYSSMVPLVAGVLLFSRIGPCSFFYDKQEEEGMLLSQMTKLFQQEQRKAEDRARKEVKYFNVSNVHVVFHLVT